MLREIYSRISWVLFAAAAIPAPQLCRLDRVVERLAALQLPMVERLAVQDLALLKKYKNDDRFAAWLDAGEAEMTESSAEILLQFDRAEQKQMNQKNAIRHETRSPRQVVLTENTLFEKSSTALCRVCQFSRELWRGKKATLYDERVLALRTGDTVVFRTLTGTRSFTLGSFLGRGNATHIFEIQGRPEAVLRIPFQVVDASGDSGHTYLRDFIRGESKIPRGVPRVRVLDSGVSGEFAVVTRVWGEENGAKFLSSRGRSLSQDAEWLEREKNLRATVIRLYPEWGLIPESDFLKRRWDEYRSAARQFVWDHKKKKWVLVDWEGSSTFGL